MFLNGKGPREKRRVRLVRRLLYRCDQRNQFFFDVVKEGVHLFLRHALFKFVEQCIVDVPVRIDITGITFLNLYELCEIRLEEFVVVFILGNFPIMVGFVLCFRRCDHLFFRNLCQLFLFL